MRTPELSVTVDSNTNVWIYVEQTGGTPLDIGDPLEQHPHERAAMRTIAQAMAEKGLRHAVINGERVDMREFAKRDAYCRQYLADYAAV